MRTPEDLRRTFDSVDAAQVDTDRMLARIHSGIGARRARRRRATILVAAAATALIAITPVVVSALNNDPPARGQVAATPSTTGEQPLDDAASPPMEFAFTVGERPPGYSTEYASTSLGVQSLAFYPPASANLPREIEIQLFDPQLSGRPVPEPIGETIAVESVSSGPLLVQVIAAGTNGDEQPRFGVGWQTGNGLWLTITSDAPRELARQEVLAVAAQVDLGAPEPLTFPFQLGYLPDGLQLIGTSRQADAEGCLQASIELDDRAQVRSEPPALLVSAANTPGVPADAAVDTTVFRYPTQPTDDGYVRSAVILYDVDGFMITISVSEAYVELIDEEEMRRIAESVVVLPGAANDQTVWTDRPLG